MKRTGRPLDLRDKGDMMCASPSVVQAMGVRKLDSRVLELRGKSPDDRRLSASSRALARAVASLMAMASQRSKSKSSVPRATGLAGCLVLSDALEERQRPSPREHARGEVDTCTRVYRSVRPKVFPTGTTHRSTPAAGVAGAAA